MEYAIGTPILDPYGNAGFIAGVKASETRSFVLSGGMRRIANEYQCCFANRISELPDGIVAPYVTRAKDANLPAVSESEVADRLQAARDATNAERARQNAEREAATRARAEFEADARGRIPAWAKAVIVAELVEDQSDSMTDYFGSTTRRTVILAFSRHVRDLFPEMRQAAANFAETAHLVDAPESAEHREKWSMGGGYYLKSGYRHSSGWRVSKRKFYDSSEPVKQLPSGEWHLAPVKPAAVRSSAPEPVTGNAVTAGLRIERHIHTKKGFAMWICILPDRVERETFDALRDKAQGLGGWYSRPWGGTPGGFAFKSESKAHEFAGSAQTGASEPESVAAAKPEPIASPATSERLRALADGMQGEIDGKFRDRLTNTPKRQREADTARLDGYRLQRTQAGLRALATAHEAGTVPAELARVTSKKAVFELVGTEIDRSRCGYYDAGVDTGKPSADSPAARALWAMLDAPKESDRLAEELRRKVQALQFANIDGYFPTPLPVIEVMILRADMPAGEFDFLEPEGGSGAILDVVRERFKGARISTYEHHNSLRDVLVRKGYALSGDDFLAAETGPRFDRILMNPPFERGQDIEHVRHAFEMLRPGGRMVAVMSPGPFFRSDRKAQEFRAWFERVGGEKHELPANSFKASGTGVATVLAVIERES